jgi:hypothetical protein
MSFRSSLFATLFFSVTYNHYFALDIANSWTNLWRFVVLKAEIC